MKDLMLLIQYMLQKSIYTLKQRFLVRVQPERLGLAKYNGIYKTCLKVCHKVLWVNKITNFILYFPLMLKHTVQHSIVYKNFIKGVYQSKILTDSVTALYKTQEELWDTSFAIGW